MTDKPGNLNLPLSMLESIASNLPKRPNKVPLTAYQKQAIKDWVAPTCTTTAKCGYCDSYYSSGYLNICKADPTQFCRNKPYELSKPEGYSDAELGYYFGYTRKELDDKQD